MITKETFVKSMLTLRYYNEALSKLEDILGIVLEKGPFLDIITATLDSLQEDTGNIAWGGEDAMPILYHFLFDEEFMPNDSFLYTNVAIAADGTEHKITCFEDLYDFLAYSYDLPESEYNYLTELQENSIDLNEVRSEELDVVDLTIEEKEREPNA